MKSFPRTVSVLLMALCILVAPFNVFMAVAKGGAVGTNPASHQNEPSKSSGIQKTKHDELFGVSSRTVGVNEYRVGSRRSVGLDLRESKYYRSIDYDFSVGSFKLARVLFAGSEWDVIICNDTINLDVYGKPTVPYKRISVPIGDTDIVDILTHENLTAEISGVKVLPGLKPMPVSFNYFNWPTPESYFDKNFRADPLIYNSNQQYPSELVTHEIVRSKGEKLLILTVFPFRFCSEKSIIRVYDVHVSIELAEPVSMSHKPQINSKFSNGSEGYTIVTSSQFSQAVTSFADWKRQLGFSVHVTPLEQIYSQFSGRDKPEKVRSFINQSYSKNGTQYFLLVGDSNVCPVREVWDPIDAGGGLDNGTEPTDLYYECLDGNWDANGNSVFGEVDDNVDLYPEVKVGRIPVNAPVDAERVLAMIRKIEEDPEPGEWIKNFLLIAPSAFTQGDSAAALEEEVNQKFLADSFYNVTRLYDTDNSLGTPNIVSSMNNGAVFVDFFDHGDYNSWSGALQAQNVLDLHNGNKSFLAFAMACETAAFDYQQYTTISEAFFRNPNGGAIGYIGATRIAWAGYDCFDGLHHRFWNDLLKNAVKELEAKPKDALQNAMAEMVATYAIEGPTRETIYQAIYFGDPALNLHWKYNVTTNTTPKLETSMNGVINGTCSRLHTGKPTAGPYKVVIKDPVGTRIAEKSGTLGSQGDYTVNFTTADVPGNYSVETTLTTPFNYTAITTFIVGALNVTATFSSDPVYDTPLKVYGQATENGNPVTGIANVSIVREETIISSETVSLNGSGHYEARINLTTFGMQSVHVWVTNGTKNGGTSASLKVKRGNILIIADDTQANPPLYPGGWYDLNRGSSTSYHSFSQALTDECNVSTYRIMYDEVPSLAFLEQYSAVIVTCGDHFGSCIASPFRDLTQVLTQFHNSGGDLLFEGGDVAYSLANSNLTGFMGSVLHALLDEDRTNTGLFLYCNTPHPITQGLPSIFQIEAGLGSPSVDLILPTNGSESVSRYVGHTGSSITAFSGTSRLGSVICFSFSVDGISNMQQRKLLIRNSIQYLLSPTLKVKLSDHALRVNTSETVSIRVEDSDTKQTIKNATITANGCGIFAQNETDDTGECSIFINPTYAGTVNVTIEKNGYPNFTEHIIVYSIPRLAVQTTPNALRKVSQKISIEVTDFYEDNDVDNVNVTLSGCGVSEAGFTNATGTVELTVIPTSYGHIQLNASKSDYENYTGFVDVYVKCVVVDSFGTDYPSYSSWDDLSDTWQEYGAIPVRVDIDSLNKLDITYRDLVESEADMLIISCSAASGREYTDEEISAISRYTLEGHGLVSTAGTFYRYVPNNNRLAPLFGMRDDIKYTVTGTYMLTLNILQPQHPLFTGVPNPYYPATGTTVVPSDFSWSQEDLLDGTCLAMSQQNECAIVMHNGAVFMSHWLEYNSNSDDLQLMYNAVVWSKYTAPEHDLRVSLDAPSYLKPNDTIGIKARIENVGRNNETNIDITLLINNTVLYNTIIPTLATGSSYEITQSWTPTATATYNVTAFLPPLVGEEDTLNNVASKSVEVRQPLINPVAGQWARYIMTFFDENGTVVGDGSINVVYDHYVAPCLMYVTIDIEMTLRMGSIIVKMQTSYWMVVNTMNRMVEDGYVGNAWFPYWIETSIGLGSEVHLAYEPFIVVGDQIRRINTRPIDCWKLVPEQTIVGNSTQRDVELYDKASGLWIGGETGIGYSAMLQISPTSGIVILAETNIPIGYQHELEVSLGLPVLLQIHEPVLVNASVYNLGLTKETNVRLGIFINGSMICSNVISELEKGTSSKMSFSWTPTNKGTYNITAYAWPVPSENLTVNNAESRIVAVTGDNTPPFISITNPPNGYITNASTILVYWQGVDNESGINNYSIYLNGISVASVPANTTSLRLSSITEGSNNITVQAYDVSGNWAIDQITLIADSTPPATEITKPSNGSYLSGSVSIITVGNDSLFDRMELYINESSVASYVHNGINIHDWNTTVFEDGSFTIKLLAYDKAGNKAVAYLSVTVDNSPPEVDWTSPSTGSYASGTTLLVFNCSDANLDEATLRIDDTILANVTGDFEFYLNTHAIAEGRHVLTLAAVDRAGNINVTQPIAIVVDNTQPTTEFLSPKESDIIRGLFKVSFRCFDANLNDVLLAMGSTTYDVSGTSQFSLNTTAIADGNCSITITATDKAGNVIVEAVTFVVDNTKPNVSFSNAAELENTELAGVVTVQFSYSDTNLEKVILYMNETAIDVTGQASYSWNTTKNGDGTHVIKLIAYDKAGNTAETQPLLAKTVAVQKSNQQNYLAGWDGGLRLGIVAGLTVGLAIGSILLINAMRRRKAPKT